MKAVLPFIFALKCEAGGHWTYSNIAAWRNIAPVSSNQCSGAVNAVGSVQSPTDINTAAPATEGLGFFETSPARSIVGAAVSNWTIHCKKHVEQFLNPHTWEIEFPLENKACGKEHEDYPHVVWGNKKYYLAQFHYHSPSEHTFSGKFTDMEVHHVHKAEDGQALVIAVNVEVGLIANSFLEQFWANFPTVLHQKVEISEETRQILPYTHFFPASTNGGVELSYYHYMGSFTTPPCTTDTVWILLKDHVYMSPEQLTAYRTAISGVKFSERQVVVKDEVPPGVVNTSITPWNTALGVNNRPVDGRVPAPLKVYEAPTAGESPTDCTSTHVVCVTKAPASDDGDNTMILAGVGGVLALGVIGGIVYSLSKGSKTTAAKPEKKKKKKKDEDDPAEELIDPENQDPEYDPAYAEYPAYDEAYEEAYGENYPDDTANDPAYYDDYEQPVYLDDDGNPYQLDDDGNQVPYPPEY